MALLSAKNFPSKEVPRAAGISFQQVISAWLLLQISGDEGAALTFSQERWAVNKYEE